jgi:drug/metabolite transporter (DMT)-like permease
MVNHLEKYNLRMNNTNLSLIYAILSLSCYSFWGVLNGLVIKQTEPYSGLFYSSLGYLLSGLFSLYFVNFQPKLSLASFGSSILLGLATGFGGLFLLLAIKKFGNSSVLVALTATYPIASLVFNYYVFNELVSIQQICGCVIVVIGIVLMLI